MASVFPGEQGAQEVKGSIGGFDSWSIPSLELYAQMAHNAEVILEEIPMSALTKDTRLHIRCDQEVRRLLDKAAAYAHMTVSEFVLRNAVEQAQALVEQHEAITLSQQDFAAFLDALDTPAQPAPALQRAFARHARQVR